MEILSAEDVALLQSLNVSPRLENYPLTILRLTQIVNDLQQRVQSLEGKRR